MENGTNLGYIAAAIFFIIGLKMLGSAATARRGNMVSAVGMLIAVVVTMMAVGIGHVWILTGLVLGSAIGAIAARRVQMTGMPEMVAIFNGLGGMASLLVALAEFHIGWEWVATAHGGRLVAIFFAALIGGVTFTGSLIAYGKLSGKVPGKPIMFRGQHIINGGLIALAVLLGALFPLLPDHAYVILLVVVVLALALGVLAVIPIGGADMPVVISLLNSYSGLAAAAAGFIIANNVLIVAGSLVGASGLILTSMMCKAMNRSLANVLLSGFGSPPAAGAEGPKGEAKASSIDDAYYVLEAARSVVFVPGYGMAVAQAQHAVRELSQLLEANGAEVNFAIHPVAGRMPGHMNVLLAEADVPYEQLMEMDAINPTMTTVDVAIVIGANDVVNPAARTDPSSPIHGMPIINVDQAKTVFVVKRSMASGFAGIENPLFFLENTRMIFGDARQVAQGLAAAFKQN